MRLRNLFEVQVKPGERKGFSLRLQKLENVQVKIAEIQQTIGQLGSVSVPDALKKQMEDLINAAKIEKEKIYAEIADSEAKNPPIQGIPGSVVKLLKGIEKNASVIMNAYRRTGKFLFRGIKSDDDALYGKPFDERRAKDSNAELSNALNKALAAQGFTARRDNTTFTSGSVGQASNYGTVYIIFPRDGFSFHYSKEIKDLVLDTSKLNMLIDPDIIQYVQNTVYANWEKLKPYFSYKFTGDRFFSDYEYRRDLDGIQQAVADGALPAEFGRFKSLEDIVDPAKVMANFKYDQEDLDGAITSGHEVMVTGPYYAIRKDKFEDYFKKYLELTRTGEFDITPDSKGEKKTFNQKLSAVTGSEPPPFDIGDWVQHKYEGFKGQVVDYYHTNDFVQIKDYEGKLVLVNKKNVEKIKTPEIPDYKPGDKLYMRTKNTEWETYNNKKLKVEDSDEFTVTVIKNSYGGTITLPKLLTEPAPKYDTNDPNVGDTVHVTGGDYKGMYGTITYVSGYSKDIDVDFGDGNELNVEKGNYEVVDPASKPADAKLNIPFEENDYVRIADDGLDYYNGVVAQVTKPGVVNTKVKMFGSEVVGIVGIKNNRLSKIEKDEFDKQAFNYGDKIVVTGGTHNGKTGTFEYLSGNGNLEIKTDSGQYVYVPSKYTFKQTADNTNTENAPQIQKGDLVKISNDSDKFPGAVAKVIVKNSKEKSTLLIYGDDNFDYIVDTQYLTKITEDEFNKSAFRKEDRVKVTSGPYEGNVGTINKLSYFGYVLVKLDDETGDEPGGTIKFTPDSLEKVIESKNNFDDDDLIDLDDIDFEPLDEPVSPKKDAEKDAILAKAKKTKKITYSEIEKMFSSNDPTDEEVSKIFDELEKLGIEITGYEELVAPSEETPQELQARINDPDVKGDLKEILKDADVKALIQKSLETKTMSYSDAVKIANAASFDKWYSAIKPYLTLKGVKVG